MKGLKIILVLIALSILFAAAWQNIPPILEKSITFQLDLYLVKWQTEPIPLWLIMPVCFLVGFALMWFIDLSTRMRLRKRVRVLEKELKTLRVQTGYDDATSLEPYADEPLEEDHEPEESNEHLSK